MTISTPCADGLRARKSVSESICVLASLGKSNRANGLPKARFDLVNEVHSECFLAVHKNPLDCGFTKKKFCFRG